MENETLLEYYISSGNQSDKGTDHNYIQELYTQEFSPLRNKETNILEIGVRYGDSIKLWREWFTKGSVYGIDTLYTSRAQTLLEGMDIKIIIDDAYSKGCVDSIPNDFFDYIIDDGPHTLESQLECVRLYLPKLKKGGKIIIEDILAWKSVESKFQQLGKELGLQYEGKHIPGSRKSDNAVAIYTK